MSESLRENASWRKGKSPIIVKYSADHAKMMAEVAGRGFLRLPGFVYDVENGIELSAKMSLSELNYKILEETITRELKQSGIDYDQTYKTVLLQWELDKQTLLNAWAAEYAGIKQQESSDEETLTRLAIEVGQRAIFLLDAKTAIDLSMEEYKRELVTLDASTYPHEVQLANQKLLTAQAKLNIIPILEGIIFKEQELLIIEQQKATQYTALIGKEAEVATKKQLLLGPLAALVNITEQYIAKLPIQILTEGQIANEKLLQAQSIGRTASARVTGLTTEIATATSEITLAAAKRTSQGSHINNGLLTDADEIAKETAFQGTLENKQADMLSDDATGQQTLITNKTDVNTALTGMRILHNQTINYKEANVTTRISDEKLRQLDEITKLEINPDTKIMAALKHIIG